MTDLSRYRNIGIFAHVDAGKTTTTERILKLTGKIHKLGEVHDGEATTDFMEQEQERGITIQSAATSCSWDDHRLNIIDTPGHADFGGEVERILSMVDSVLLLVDAVEGPMPQTRFVTRKAFENNLSPIVMVNKIDRDGARPDWVVDQVFELFDQLGANDHQLDFPVIYGSALEGRAGISTDQIEDSMECLIQTLIDNVPGPEITSGGPLQMQISALDYNSYVGVIGIGRVQSGRLETGDQVIVVNKEREERPGRILQVLDYRGLERIEVSEAEAGDIVCITGIENLYISDLSLIHI